mmetsp:Transcript_24584/g.53470  ORF Transcript_24584/g.53470 Transcript_24584/m.53470 type:complete len:270 (-) Transcript_24584:100-909(-)
MVGCLNERGGGPRQLACSAVLKETASTRWGLSVSMLLKSSNVACQAEPVEQHPNRLFQVAVSGSSREALISSKKVKACSQGAAKIKNLKLSPSSSGCTPLSWRSLRRERTRCKDLLLEAAARAALYIFVSREIEAPEATEKRSRASDQQAARVKSIMADVVVAVTRLCLEAVWTRVLDLGNASWWSCRKRAVACGQRCARRHARTAELQACASGRTAFCSMASSKSKHLLHSVVSAQAAKTAPNGDRPGPARRSLTCAEIKRSCNMWRA